MKHAAPDPLDPTEVEIKLDFDLGALPGLQAALCAFGGEARTDELVSTYYDDAEETLRRQGFTLRVRQVGGDCVQTVKAEGAELFSRGEWEAPVASASPDLEAARDTPLKAALARAGPLRPLFTSRVRREARSFDWSGGRVEAALDIGEIEADGGRRAPVRQLELELKDGAPELLFRLVRALSDQSALRLTFETKSGQGYALLSPPPEVRKGAPAPLSREMTVGEGFQAVARAALRQVVDNTQVVRARRAVEALHQLRVGLRRLRAALSLFKPVVSDDRVDAVKAELKWLSGELNDARDADVFIAETYEPGVAALGEGEGLADLGKLLKKARTRGYDRAIKALGSRRGRDTVLAVAEWVEAGPWLTGEALAPARGTPAGRFAARSLAHRRKAVLRAGAKLQTLSPERRHKLRIAAKKLRYGADFFAPLLHEGRAKRFTARLRTVQDSLGALNDIAVSRRKAHDLVAGASAQLGVAAGLVVGLRAGDEPALIKAAARQLKALRQARTAW